jgi:hypothetical protein
VILQHGIEVFNFGLKAGSGKPKENDAGMEESLMKDQLTEVAVRDQQNALLVSSDCQDIRIRRQILSSRIS